MKTIPQSLFNSDEENSKREHTVSAQFQRV